MEDIKNTEAVQADGVATAMVENVQNRLQSKAAWVAIFALLGFILGNWGLFDMIGLTNESWEKLVELILAALAAFGVFNNPTKPDGF